MISTFKETLISIRNKDYGRVIIHKSFKQVIGYWLKYVLIFSVVPVIIIIAVMTYFIPQLPRLIKDNIAPGEVRVEKGKFSSTYHQPLNINSSNFSLILDSHGSPSDLDKVASGLLVLSDRVLIKSPDGQITSQSLSQIGDFSLSQSQIVSWISHHQGLLWFELAAAVVVFSFLSGLFYIGYKLVTFLVWAAVFLVFARVTRRPYRYVEIYKIVVYAAVPAFIFSALFSLFPNFFLSFLNLGIFVFLAVTWLSNLDFPTRNKK